MSTAPGTTCPRCTTGLMEERSVALRDGSETRRLDCRACGWCEPGPAEGGLPDADGSSLASLRAALEAAPC